MLRDTEMRLRPSWLLLGPAFVAAIAYVDPGNVAANVSAGAQFGFLLVWVILLANVMAGLVQYLSAKLGLVTGRSLPEAVARPHPHPDPHRLLAAGRVGRHGHRPRRGRGRRASRCVCCSTCRCSSAASSPAWCRCCCLRCRTAAASAMFERVISGLLLIIAIGFLTSLFVQPAAAGDVVAGLLPRFEGAESVLLATAMLGATVMPHAVYLHSGLARDRHGHPDAGPQRACCCASPDGTSRWRCWWPAR